MSFACLRLIQSQTWQQSKAVMSFKAKEEKKTALLVLNTWVHSRVSRHHTVPVRERTASSFWPHFLKMLFLENDFYQNNMPCMSLVQTPESLWEPACCYIAYFHRNIQRMVMRRKELSNRERTVVRGKQSLHAKGFSRSENSHVNLVCTDGAYTSAWVSTLSQRKGDQQQQKSWFLWTSRKNHIVNPKENDTFYFDDYLYFRKGNFFRCLCSNSALLLINWYNSSSSLSSPSIFVEYLVYLIYKIIIL